MINKTVTELIVPTKKTYIFFKEKYWHLQRWKRTSYKCQIKKYQRYEALKKTYHVRPDLLAKATLTNEDLKMLEEIKNEKN